MSQFSGVLSGRGLNRTRTSPESVRGWLISGVLSGLVYPESNPALKCRAFVECSFGTNFPRPFRSHTVFEQIPATAWLANFRLSLRDFGIPSGECGMANVEATDTRTVKRRERRA